MTKPKDNTEDLASKKDNWAGAAAVAATAVAVASSAAVVETGAATRGETAVAAAATAVALAIMGIGAFSRSPADVAKVATSRPAVAGHRHSASAPSPHPPHLHQVWVRAHCGWACSVHTRRRVTARAAASALQKPDTTHALSERYAPRLRPAASSHVNRRHPHASQRHLRARGWQPPPLPQPRCPRIMCS